MKISIITVVLNRRSTIGSAIDSVACQNYENIEHLIIDGGSTDGTLAEIEAHRHPSMRFISEPDDGIYHAINKGISFAVGDVIGLVHSDDFLAHANVLDRVASALVDPMIDAVYGDLDYVSAVDSSAIIRRWHAGRMTPRKLRWGWMPPHPTIFAKRQVFENHQAYDTNYRIAADYDAILRWFGRGQVHAAYVPEVLVKMRVGGASNASLAPDSSAELMKTIAPYAAIKWVA